jgi:hypothetical protein
MIEIWQPRYKDRKVLIATYKVGDTNTIVFTKSKYLKGKVFKVSGEVIRKYPKETNGTIECYAVPMSELEMINE